MTVKTFVGVDLTTRIRQQIYRSFSPRPTLIEQLADSAQSKLPVAVPKDLSLSKDGTRQQSQMPSQSIQHKLPSSLQQRDVQLAALTLTIATGGVVFPILNLVAIPGVLYCVRPIFERAYKFLKEEKRVTAPAVTTVTILSSLAFGYVFISSLSTFLFALSDKFRQKIINDTKGELIDVFKLIPNQVWLLRDGMEVAIPIDQVKPGDWIVVHAGGVIPVDGVIQKGIASIDQRVLTGEGTPVEKEQGQEVFASTVVHSGQIVVEVQRIGDETTLAKIGNILNRSIEFKSTVTLRAIKLADRTALPAILMGVVAFPFLGPEGAAAVTDTHFKNKMGLIAPISIMNFFKVAARQGIIIKDGRSFELLNRVDTIVFDKTGTLTEDQPTVGKIHLCAQICAQNGTCQSDRHQYDEMAVLRFAATAEYKQTHPIAKAILAHATSQQLDLPAVEEIDYKVGYGLSVTVAGQLIQVGSLRFMQLSEIEIPSPISTIQKSCFEQGHSLLMVAVDQQLVGAIELIPTIRPEAKAVIQKLMQRQNITASYIISGDNETPTRILAQELGIDHYFAETLPEDKAKLIGRLREEGRFICYVGDGINDSIALRQAHVSVSLSGASKVAIDTAQIILMKEGLTHLDRLFDLSKQFERNMNLIFTVVTVPALFGLGSILLYGGGLAATTAYNMTGLLCGIGSAMLPALQDKLASYQLESDQLESGQNTTQIETKENNRVWNGSTSRKEYTYKSNPAIILAAG